MLEECRDMAIIECEGVSELDGLRCPVSDAREQGILLSPAKFDRLCRGHEQLDGITR